VPDSPTRLPDLSTSLIVGLGNPEPRYQRNRHNLGFRVVDALGEKIGAEWARKFDGELAQGNVGGVKVLLLKPQTFMNRSGDSVAPAVRFFKLALTQVLVAHDELDLELGRIQLKQGGGSGGHNGLRSIEAALGSKDFGRLRLGIGRPPAEWDAADYVLSDFAKSEEEAVEVEVQSALAALTAVISEGMQKAMTQHNRWEKS
jgi:PTH1 family peptidyl-tRNA hydrolase